jgi:hypothetical protein
VPLFGCGGGAKNPTQMTLHDNRKNLKPASSPVFFIVLTQMDEIRGTGKAL